MIEELYGACHRELVNRCSNMTGSREKAEDLVQEAFLRAMKHEELLETLDEKQRRAWLYRTVKNLFVDKARRDAFCTAAEELPEDTVWENRYGEIESDLLLDVLTEEERSLFVLRYLRGYSSRELGQSFSLPPGTVRAKLSLARKRLRKALEE